MYELKKLELLILKPDKIEMIHALLFMFSRKPQNRAFHVLFSKEDDGKVLAGCFSHEVSYSVL